MGWRSVALDGDDFAAFVDAAGRAHTMAEPSSSQLEQGESTGALRRS